MTAIRHILLAATLLFALASGALAERRVALVLGNGGYRHLRALANPVSDARTVEEVLKGLGFEVWTETDRDLRRMRRALADFEQDGAGADVALLFYAGHGVAIAGLNYLLPVDAEATSSGRLEETSLPLAEVQEVLNRVAPVAIVLLDACRDDPFDAGAAGGGRGAAPLAEDPPDAARPVPGLGRIGRADGVLFAFAAAPGETASDGSGGNSPFTAALARHFATPGVELKSALTLVQQDVYDRSRGRQLPYIESGLPRTVFLSAQGELTEREGLMIAMAGLTPDLRAEVEAVAARNAMPLAPLYAALISSDLASLSAEERHKSLAAAAQSYGDFQAELARYAGDDPRVAALRARAEEQLSLGAPETARALLTEAAEIDKAARLAIRDNYLSRTLSEATTHVLNASAARTDLKYALAIDDLAAAVVLYAEIRDRLPDRQARQAYSEALESLGNLQLVAGDSNGARAAYMTQVDFLKDMMRQAPADIGFMRDLVWAMNAVGGVLVQQGFVQEAEQVFAEAFDTSRQQSEAQPDDIELRRYRAVMRRRLGEVHMIQTDYIGALADFRAALVIAAALLDGDPQNTVFLADMGTLQQQIGDVELLLGNHEEARDAFDLSLRISQQLVDLMPGDAEARRNLSTDYERLGDMMVQEGDLDSALAVYLEAQRIREDLLALDPANALRRRDSAVTYERIGDIYSGLGDSGSALMAQLQAMAIREELAALDPQNAEWLRDLSVSYERVGNIHFDEGDPGGARESYGKCLALREQMLALDPSNLNWQRDLGVALGKLASLAAAQQEPDEAHALMERVLAVRRALAEADPTVAPFRSDLALALRDLAALESDHGTPEAAREALAEAIAYDEGLVAEAPGDEDALRDLALDQTNFSAVLLVLADAPAAVMAARSAVEATGRLLQLRPGDARYLTDRLVAFNRLGDAQGAAGDLDGALGSFRTMAELGYVLSSADAWDMRRAANYAVALERLGGALTRKEDFDAARAELSKAVDLRAWLAGQDAGSLDAQRDLALVLQSLAATHFLQRAYDLGRPLEEQALGIMRWIEAQRPGEPRAVVDVVAALDRLAGYYADPAPLLREALALLEGLAAEGRLPDGYDRWIPDFRDRLGQP